MFSKFFKTSSTTRTVLFISLSNIGDIVLTFPVFDALCEAYPDALFSIVVSPKGKIFFEGHPRVKNIHVLDKQSGIRDKVRWLGVLRRQKFDLIVDLRNSMLPFLVRGRRRTRPVFWGEAQGHMREKHLRRIQRILNDIPLAHSRHALVWSRRDEGTVKALLMGLNNFVVIAPGAADPKKCWPEENFTALTRYLMKDKGVQVVMVGDRKDGKIAERVLRPLPSGVLNLCGLTTLKELALIVTKARLAVVNDSGIMHLASYQDIPTVALFGPTDPERYGPWGKNAAVVRSFSGRMMDTEVKDVVAAVNKALA